MLLMMIYRVICSATLLKFSRIRVSMEIRLKNRHQQQSNISARNLEESFLEGTTFPLDLEIMNVNRSQSNVVHLQIERR